MKSIDQVRMGIIRFYDTQVRHALPEKKAIAYGMIIEAAMLRPEKWIEKIAPGAMMSNMMDEEGNVDVETIVKLLREQMKKGSGKLEFEIGINPLKPEDKDRFVFTQQDIEKLMRCMDE